MDQLKAMTVFVNIIEQGSLTAAAEKLDCSTTSVVRALAALEKQLGIRLINRNTRTISVTIEGNEYYGWAKHILNEMDVMTNIFEAKVQQPAGLLKITAPMTFGQKIVAPLVAAYLNEYEDMSIHLVLNDRNVDLMEESYDLAIRIGALPDSTCVATPIATTKLVRCASPKFLRKNLVEQPADLATCRCIVFNDMGKRWKFNQQEKVSFIEVQATLMTNQIGVAKQACLDGVGVAQFYHYQVAEELEIGQLIELFPDDQQDLIPINLLYPHSKLLSSRVKHFLTWFKQQISEKV
ncbi:LysR family transcriptional regulator [Acinetobacter rudis]|uniref:LysR family transcriptional regulator n=1 Tax=Acinetobacter rudis TaxID=632955 RepID=A0AAW8JBX8_9GAMM|nr:LysR family transcriptional regulator [Acinetobacter rudis]MDQ8936363.1 LysR family transcriptional regulator [Acinetobacter rudis]MDQ8953414.1 LysR family transcriptional regulator [Acinetobacter rudis]MDQ9018624.1 LysR family transcriptional regulator [Acinetobacter rudis]